MKLYVIVDATICDAVAVAAAAAKAGAHYIQLRYMGASDETYTSVANEVAAALRGTNAVFLLSERPHLVAATGADGVHIGETYRDLAEARRLIGPTGLLGASQFTGPEADAAVGSRYTLDYLSVGPVWTTVSKSDAGAAIGVEASVARARENGCRAAFIGGITAENLGQLKCAAEGIDGIAVVLGAVCRAADPAAATAELLAILSAG